MRSAKALLLIVLALSASGVAAPTTSFAPPDTQLRRELVRYLRSEYRDLPPYASRKYVKYGYALVDLNGDGTDEALVYVTGGMCGTGGCGLDILTRHGSGWRMVTSTGIGYAPIRILSTKTNGWRDLAVHARISASEHYDARLRFNGKRYPDNPTAAPALPLRRGAHGRVVIADATIPLFAE